MKAEALSHYKHKQSKFVTLEYLLESIFVSKKYRWQHTVMFSLFVMEIEL